MRFEGEIDMKAAVELCELRLQRKFRDDGVFDWLNDCADNRWQYDLDVSQSEGANPIFYVDMLLCFLTPQDAFAFKLRWL